MAAPVYATSADYSASPYGQATAPADIDDRLAIASRDIDELTITAYYDTDVNQQATDTDVRDALRQATIAQASYGIDPSAGLAENDLPPGFTSVSLGSASMTRAKAAPEFRVGGVAYHPRVYAILRQGGLMGTEPWPGY